MTNWFERNGLSLIEEVLENREKATRKESIDLCANPKFDPDFY